MGTEYSCCQLAYAWIVRRDERNEEMRDNHIRSCLGGIALSDMKEDCACEVPVAAFRVARVGGAVMGDADIEGSRSCCTAPR